MGGNEVREIRNRYLFRVLVARIFLAARSLLDRLHRYLTSPPLGQTRIQSRTRLLSTNLSPRTTASIMTYLESCARVPIIESVYRKRNSRRRFVRSNVIASTSYLRRLLGQFVRPPYDYVFDNDALLSWNFPVSSETKRSRSSNGRSIVSIREEI